MEISENPKVFLVARPSLNLVEIDNYLNEIGAVNWSLPQSSDAEALVEVMGRACYKSFGADLNPNITRVRKASKEYLQNIVRVGHGSVLEHASFSFMITGVSRVFTHELVRHRAGTAISQESLRFLRLTDIKTWVPNAIIENDSAMKIFIEAVESQEQYLLELEAALGINNMTNFSAKKIATSAMRRIAPMGISTSVGWTANLRTLRHVIEMRTSRHSEEEIRYVFGEIYKIMRGECPYVFADYRAEEVNGYLEVTTENTKV